MESLAVGRSHWLAELAQAVDEAQRLVWEFGSSAGLRCDTLDLYARLEGVRAELDSIRRGRGETSPAAEVRGFPNPEAFERVSYQTP